MMSSIEFSAISIFSIYSFCVFSVILEVMFKALSICQYLCSSQLDPTPQIENVMQ